MAACAFGADALLDYDAVKRAYVDGDFTKVSTQCENGLKAGGASQGDSLFAAHYLGVVYAANPATRERGRFWFGRLLRQNPEASLANLLVSEEVEAIFAKVREEVWLELGMGPSKAFPNAGEFPPRTMLPSSKKAVPQDRSRGGLWLMAGSVTVAALVVGYLLTNESPPPEERVITW